MRCAFFGGGGEGGIPVVGGEAACAQISQLSSVAIIRGMFTLLVAKEQKGGMT